jgi:predicted nucleic acid-binding protein
MDEVVLDTTVLVKSIFMPHKSLAALDYARELETHEKCSAIIRLIEEHDVAVYLPRVCIIETSAVIKRLAGKAMAIKVSKGLIRSYSLVGEDALFDLAWDVAVDTGCSGFDSYFIALAMLKDATLITDDLGMYRHSQVTGADSISVRAMDIDGLRSTFGRPFK